MNNSPVVNDKNQLKICALNVCGLNSKLINGVFSDYLKMFDIFCVTESKVSKGNIIDNYSVYNLSKSDKYRLPGVHGLHIYIKNSISGKCEQIYNKDFLCKAVLWIKIANDFILGAIYVPNQRSNYYCSQFFEELAHDICYLRNKYDLPFMLTGDFNSHTGTLNDISLTEICDNVLDISHFKYPNVLNMFKNLDIPLIRANKDTTVNNNGKDLIGLCLSHEFCIINGRFGDDKNIGSTTFDDKSTLDYVLCTPELLGHITNFTVDRFDPLLSDAHNPIHITLNMAKNLHTVHPIPIDQSSTNNNSNEMQTKSEWDKSKSDEYQKHFDKDKIKLMLDNLDLVDPKEVTSETIKNFAEDFKNMLIEPAKTTGMVKQIPTTKKVNKQGKQNKPWFNTLCKESVKNYKKGIKLIPKQNKKQKKQLAKKHMKLIRKEKRKYFDEVNEKIKFLKTSNQSAYWKIINQGKKNKKVGDIPSNTVFSHFAELNFNNETRNINDDTPIIPNENVNEAINKSITEDEIIKHISSLKNNKCPGIDNILNEFLKYCPKELIPVIVKFFNIVLDSGIIPDDWITGIIKPLYKNKGDINDISNYRGITLLSCIGKLFTSVLNTRLYSFLTNQNLLGNEQAGFRPQHSTLDHIFALHILSKFYIDQKKRLFCAFVDYSKAFDFIDRTYLWQKLINTNINGKVLNVIRNMYQNAKSQVSFNNTLSDPFPCQVGVRQGENLSPLLFAIYLNDFNKFLSERYNGLSKVTDSISQELHMYLKIFCLLYADDTLVLAETEHELQKALDGLHDYCNKWALKVNVDKTKVIIFAPGRVRKFKSFKFGNSTIDVVTDYVYLGTTFNYNGTFHKAKAKQALQARKATYGLITRIKQLNLTFEVSIELFERLIIPILLYGSEVWGYEDPKQLQTMFSKTMRRFLRLHKTTPMCMIDGELGLKEISEFIDNRMMNFWCNIATGDETKMSSILYKWIKIHHEKNTYKSIWIEKVKDTLANIQMPYFFDNVTKECKNWFKNTTKTRLEEFYAKKWSDTVYSNSSCLNYRAMTLIKKKQNYVLKLPKYYVYAMCKLKCINHYMPIVAGRYNNIPLDDRLCTLCQLNEIGDEFHYLFNCTFFANQRARYIKPYYYIQPNMLKMTQLFESSDFNEMLNLAKYADVIVKQFK